MPPKFSKASGIFALFVLTAGLALAAAYDVNLACASLPLKNGRTLSDVVIKSYDLETGNVMVTSGRTLSTFQVELLPDDVAAKLAELVPDEAKAAARAKNAARKETEKASADSGQAAQAQIDAERDAARKARQASEEAEAQAKATELAKAKQVALQKANHYFTYEYDPGSSSSLVVKQGIILDEPEEVPGWPGRLSVAGSVGLEFYDSRGKSFSKTTRKFEVTVQRNSRGIDEVVGFILK